MARLIFIYDHLVDNSENRDGERKKRERGLIPLVAAVSSQWIGSPTVHSEWNRRWAISVLLGRVEWNGRPFSILASRTGCAPLRNPMILRSTRVRIATYRHSILIGPLCSFYPTNLFNAPLCIYTFEFKKILFLDRVNVIVTWKKRKRISEEGNLIIMSVD